MPSRHNLPIIMNKYIAKIRRSANIGLYGSILICLCVVVEHYLDKHVWVHEITTNEYTRHLFVVVGLVLAVGTIAYSLFSMRRGVPRLRQTDAVEQKLRGYSTLIRTVYYLTLIVTLFVGAIIIITRENVLIMLLMLLALSLVLCYPNMYKIKADTGLTDDQMKELFGDEYKQ